MLLPLDIYVYNYCVMECERSQLVATYELYEMGGQLEISFHCLHYIGTMLGLLEVVDDGIHKRLSYLSPILGLDLLPQIRMLWVDSRTVEEGPRWRGGEGPVRGVRREG